MRTHASVAADGRILSLEAEILEGFGAYCFYSANYISNVVVGGLGASSLAGGRARAARRTTTS